MLLAITISSCKSNFKPQDVKKTPEYKKLLAENDSLKKILEPITNQNHNESTKSNTVINNGKISIVKIETGYDPYHNTSNLWLPCIAIKFKNISNQDINDDIKITTIFIDNTEGEQIGSDFNYLSTNSEIFISGTTKQLTFSCYTGWYAIQNQDVKAKIYVNDKHIETLNIINREFDGMIR